LRVPEFCAMMRDTGYDMGGAIAPEGRGGVRLSVEREADLASLSTLFVRFRSSLSRYFSRYTADRYESEDMVQEVFLKLARRGGMVGVHNPSSYIFQTAANVSLDRNRRRQSHFADHHQEYDHERHGEIAAGPEHILLDRERLEQVRIALAELPERTRQVFTLRRIDGLRYAELARQMDISVSTAEKEMQRAVLHLAAKLGTYDVSA
jgi:RNA polymerase sigma factor (sigma-70 family)